VRAPSAATGKNPAGGQPLDEQSWNGYGCRAACESCLFDLRNPRERFRCARRDESQAGRHELAAGVLSWPNAGFCRTRFSGRERERNDANAFCKWLTNVEIAAGKISTNEFYRLPTDAEWSFAVGIGDREAGVTPKNKSAKLENTFPWGAQFPPPPGAGNFADQAALNYFTNWPHIENYNDGFVTTAPVGSFKPNEFGIYDLAGNALEWCADFYDALHKQRVLRGGAWNNCGPKSLLSSYREHAAPERFSVVTGFRCVLEKSTGANGEDRGMTK
jgi:hypothetical protein